MNESDKARLDAQCAGAQRVLAQTVLGLEASGCGPAPSLMALAELAGLGILAFPQQHRPALLREAFKRMQARAQVTEEDIKGGFSSQALAAMKDQIASEQAKRQ